MGLFGISIHALRKESDWQSGVFLPFDVISIHALRKESDDSWRKFWSAFPISIHALRKESDGDAVTKDLEAQHFNPRSP